MQYRFNTHGLIEVTLKGGLGNQLFQFAFGLNSAIENDCYLKLNTEWFQSQKLRQPIIGSLLGVELNVPLEVKGHDRNLDLNPAVSLKQKKSLKVISQSEMHYNSKYLSEKNCKLDGYWQSERYFFENAPQIKGFIGERMNLGPLATSRLIVHVRRGDYLKKDTLKVHGLLTRDYYDRACNFLNVNPDERFLVIENADQLELSMKEFAQENSFHVIDQQSELDDLRLISTASHVVIANSTFSWWGAYLSKAQVISPRNWFAPEELRAQNICDVYPDDWILL
jgi:hypothetical protein